MGAYTSSLSVVTMKSRSLKHMCASGTQLMSWLAIQSLVWMSRCAKGPYLVRQLSVFRVTIGK